MEEHVKQTARNSILIFILLTITGLTGYFIRITLARNLSVTEYGLFYSVLALFGFFSIFVDFGLTQGTINRLVEYRVNNKFNEMKNLALSILYLQLIIAAILSVVLILLQKFLSENYYKTDISAILLPLCLYFVTLPLILFIVNIIYSFGKSVFQSALNALTNVFMLMVILIGLYSFNLTIKAPAYAYALVNIFALIICTPVFFRLLPGFLKIKFQFDFFDVWRTFKYGFYVTLATMGGAIITQTDTLMLTYYSGLEQVGIYQVAVPIAMTLLFFASAVSGAIYPLFCEFKTKEDYGKMSKLTTFIYSYIWIAVLPAVIILFVYPDMAINILFGTRFLAGVKVLQIFAVAMPFITFSTINYNILAAIGGARRTFKMILTAAGLNVVLNFILIPKYDMIGAAVASVISFLTLVIFSMNQLRKTYKFYIPFWRMIKIFCCGLVFFWIIYLLKKYLELNIWIELVIVLVISGFVYIIILFLTKCLNKKMLEEGKMLLFKK